MQDDLNELRAQISQFKSLLEVLEAGDTFAAKTWVGGALKLLEKQYAERTHGTTERQGMVRGE